MNRMLGEGKELNAYEELGKYVIEFQTIPFLLQGSIQIILEKKGLSNEKDSIISRIVLAEKSVFHLLSIYQSLIRELFGEESEDSKVVELIIHFIKNHINNKRNDILHAFLHIPNDSLDDLVICREKFDTSKGFRVLGERDIQKDHIKKQIEIIEEISLLLWSIAKNLSDNYKIIGEVMLAGKKKVNISLENTKKLIDHLKKIITPSPPSLSPTTAKPAME